ncbi:MAG: iron(III) transport system ATP-binding protein [Alphaproteobacteria bacterium]|jgi:iron(III) transport system ATP-binding protein
MIGVSNLVKIYPDRGKSVVAADDVTFVVEEHTFYTLLGPSGCGKTTTLRSVAGLEDPDGGRIEIGEEVVFDGATDTNVPIQQRDIGMVFQSYAIWPHMTVFENTAFPLRVDQGKNFSEKDIKNRVGASLEMVGLGDYSGRMATQLSGGQQQRLALARALVREPGVLLLDEPLSNLDAKLRDEMRIEIKEMQSRLGITTLYVTHDQSEALLMSDRIAVMNEGRIVQEGTPDEIYAYPKTLFVADFIGSTNLIRGRLDIAARCVMADDETGPLAVHPPDGFNDGDHVVVCLRPEDIELSFEAPRNGGTVLTGQIRAANFLGEIVDVRIDVKGREIKARHRRSGALERGRTVYLDIPPEACIVLEDN